MNCDATKAIHSAVELEIKEDEQRQFTYWYIICPDNFIIDNRVFSEDDEHVLSDEVPMKLDKDDGEFEVDLFAVAIYWRVGLAGGRRLKETKKKIDKKNLFM